MSEKLLTLVYSYYETPNLLKRQVFDWSTYDSLKDDISICIVDDCSAKYPVNPEVMEKCSMSISAFQITEKKSWNWSAARNIGAMIANSKWLLLTDIDHTIDNKNLSILLSYLGQLDEGYIYQFDRTDGQTGEKKTPHGASFLMTKELFWKIGGYDERLGNLYHNFLSVWKKKAKKNSKGFIVLDIPLVWIDVREVGDKRYIPTNNSRLNKKRLNGKEVVLSLPYEKVL